MHYSTGALHQQFRGVTNAAPIAAGYLLHAESQAFGFLSHVTVQVYPSMHTGRHVAGIGRLRELQHLPLRFTNEASLRVPRRHYSSPAFVRWGSSCQARSARLSLSECADSAAKNQHFAVVSSEQAGRMENCYCFSTAG